jgi:hypothetical protein
MSHRVNSITTRFIGLIYAAISPFYILILVLMIPGNETPENKIQFEILAIFLISAAILTFIIGILCILNPINKYTHMFEKIPLYMFLFSMIIVALI